MIIPNASNFSLYKMTDSNFELRNRKQKYVLTPGKYLFLHRSQGLIDWSQGMIEKYHWISLEARTRDKRL